MTRGGFDAPTHRPSITIIQSGPYHFTRNAIYLGMILGQIGLAIAFDNLWLLITLVLFALVIRYDSCPRRRVSHAQAQGRVP